MGGLRKGTKRVYVKMVLVEDKLNSERSIKSAIKKTILRESLAIRISEIDVWDLK